MNNSFRNVENRRARSVQYIRWIDEAGWIVNTQRAKPLPPGKWGVLIYVPDDMCGDIDNRVKPILDLMVKLGLASDDRNVSMLTIMRLSAIESGFCFVKAFALPGGSDDVAGGGASGPAVSTA